MSFPLDERTTTAFERPASFSLFLTCSYWRARFVPFLTPRGGISILLGRLPPLRYPRPPAANLVASRSPTSSSIDA